MNKKNDGEMQYDIVISGTIGGWDCLSTGYVRYLLDQKKDKDVHVAFCSLGDYVRDGLVMNQLFKDHGKVHAHAFGMNASISTIAMLGCSTIDIVKGSFFLIHNTSTLICKYDQKNKEQLDVYIKEITRQRNDLSTFDDVLAQMYAEKTGKSKEACAAQMKKGNWLTAQQAVDFGLVDSIREDDEDEKKAAAISNRFVNLYSNNNHFEEAGIPPLPTTQGQPSLLSVVDSEGNPTPGFLRKAAQGIKNLFLHKDNAENNEQMSKTTVSTLTALAVTLGVDALTLDENGMLCLTEEQARTLNEKFANAPGEPVNEKPGTGAPADHPEEAPTDEIANIRAELEQMKASLAQRDEQIKNLQGSANPGDKSNDHPADGQPAFGASDVANCLKEV